MEVTMMAMISMFWTPETPVLGLCTRLQSRSRLVTSLSLKIAELAKKFVIGLGFILIYDLDHDDMRQEENMT